MSTHEAFPSPDVPARYRGEFDTYVAGIVGAYQRSHLDSMLLEGGESGLIIGGILPVNVTKSASTVEADIRQMFGYQNVIVKPKITPKRRRARGVRKSRDESSRKSRKQKARA